MGFAAMKMVNGRVDERHVDKAKRVLEERGLTVSAFIRNSIEHVARTGDVPESGLPAKAPTAGIDALRDTIRKLESLPMPGKRKLAGLGEDEMLERLRMEKYGY